MAPTNVDELLGTGLLTNEDKRVRSRFTAEPYDRLLLLSDHREGPEPPRDVVLGVNPSAVATARLTPRRHVHSFLDLGTGCGIQALLAARHSDRVVGIDINARALELSKANSLLNHTTNVSWRHGNWLEPVAGQRFDLIVANPPYVFSPDSTYLYRDSNLPPESLARELISRIPQHLEEGGIAQVMLNWRHESGSECSDSLFAALTESGCDALIVRLAVDDSVDYSAWWNSPLLMYGREVYEAAVERWVAYHRRHNIEAIAWGAVLLRRRPTGQTWLRTLAVDSGPSGPAGDHVLRLFAAHDRLSELSDDSELLDAVFELVPNHLISQTLTYREGRYRSHPARVRVAPGLEVGAAIDPDTLPTFFRCDGRRTLRELMDAEGDASAISYAARELLTAGLLISASPP